MSKRNNIAYIKPREPSFLTKLKQEANYKEGPTVDSKRSNLPTYEEDESYDDDNPTVVVLNEGDLTSDEALKEKLAKEQDNNSPADLSKRIIFKRPAKSTPQSEEKHRVNKKKKRTEKLVLSFDDEEEYS
ncbi:uncharacterized protein KIAA1143 homolog isoform X2 [Sipha flava]|uniref:Uncharacterized protein KIAA1143 homolog isoform X2 n=1 Tax=Sipha flava TaxID=143950 RepID=A0A8B8GRN2_9HEMI|nr:uncharacterized protein KIAA1143 homolog isoform X2 [Sipha flava]